jgi:hypothetical protein
MRKGAAAQFLDSVRVDGVAAAREHLWFITIVAGYVLLTFVAQTFLGHGTTFSLTLYHSLLPRVIAVIGALLLAWRTLRVIAARPKGLARAIVADLSGYAVRKRVIRALPVAILLPLFYSAFTSMKTAIPAIARYRWDPIFAAWDRALHGGVDPWRILQPIVGHPVMTVAIGFLYLFLGLIMVGCWAWQALTLRDPQLRLQFFTAFVLCWAVLGNLMATLLASGGPCYYALLVGGPDPYAPLLQYLRGTSAAGFPVWSLGLQDMLWANFSSGDLARGSGISAMPSIHVSVATLLALLGWRTHRALGLAMTVLAAVILVGSVHLGWHYAIDGYAAIVGTVIIWCGVGRMIRRNGRVITADLQ